MPPTPLFTAPSPLRLPSPPRPCLTRYLCKQTTITALKSKNSRPAIRPKQSLSQTFLTCPETIQRIVSLIQTLSPTNLIEIGPGLGALTLPLYQHYPGMKAIEIDKRAVQHLSNELPNISVTHADVLTIDWESFGHELTVIGNLPYHITSQILFSLFETREVKTAILMMQKEVAQRVVSPIRNKNYGILSVVSQLYSKPELLFTIPSTAFYPIPKVESAMVKFDMTPTDGFDVGDKPLQRKVRRVVRAAFGQRRKVLRNSLKGVVEVPERIEACRAEEISPMGFVELAGLVGEIDDSRGGIWR